MKITIIVDNHGNTAFHPEFGLSLLIQEKDQEYLFDTGAGVALYPNLVLLKKDPTSIKNVILSHGHYDHTGGLRFLSPEKIYCCPGVQEGHFSRHEDGTMHQITMPEAAQKVLNAAPIQWIGNFQAISENIYLTGPIPRVSGENCGGDFYHDEQCCCRDEISEETALLSKDGTLITGCCHAGIINTLLFCRECHPEIKIRKVIGGLHLLHADRERLSKTADFLRKSEIRELYLLHCTGESAIDYLRGALPDISVFVPMPGSTIEM